MCACLSLFACVYLCVFAGVCAYVNVCVCVVAYVHAFVCVFVGACVHVRMCVKYRKLH